MKHYAKIYEGLFDRKHYEQMGPAIWMYTFLVLKETYGFVKQRVVISDAEFAGIIGCREHTVRDWRKRLQDNGYIEATRHERGFSYAIQKSKKFAPYDTEENPSQCQISDDGSPLASVRKTARQCQKNVQNFAQVVEKRSVRARNKLIKETTAKPTAKHVAPIVQVARKMREVRLAGTSQQAPSIWKFDTA
jgi:hypothetical protein